MRSPSNQSRTARPRWQEDAGRYAVFGKFSGLESVRGRSAHGPKRDRAADPRVEGTDQGGDVADRSFGTDVPDRGPGGGRTARCQRGRSANLHACRSARAERSSSSTHGTGTRPTRSTAARGGTEQL